MQTNDSATMADGTGFSRGMPAQPFYVDVVPQDLARIVVEALRRDLLSPYQTLSIFEAAGNAVCRQENG